MVKVEDYSKREELENAKFRTAMDLAKKFFPEAQIETKDLVYTFFLNANKKQILVMCAPIANIIDLYSKDYFDSAMKLAEEYEKVSGEEVTLNKRYKD